MQRPRVPQPANRASSVPEGADCSPASRSFLQLLRHEMQSHAPFTFVGAVSGIAILVVFLISGASSAIAARVFWSLHPLHVLLSAQVTSALFTRHRRAGWKAILAVGYLGSVGIATVSDCVIPFLGESFLGLPHRGLHLGFLEKWWLVNPLAIAGILLGYVRPHTRLPHAGHVLLSTGASLFHMTMALGGHLRVLDYLGMGAFLFFAVWIPCCTSDIVFPLLLVRSERDGSTHRGGGSNFRRVSSATKTCSNEIPWRRRTILRWNRAAAVTPPATSLTVTTAGKGKAVLIQLAGLKGV